MIDIILLLNNYSLPYVTKGKNIGKEWIGVDCPFCGDAGNHGGFNIVKGYYNCWKCGGKHLTTAIAKLLNIPHHKAQDIINNPIYKLRTGANTASNTKVRVKYTQSLKCVLPAFTDDMKGMHKKYLKKRNYNPAELMMTWNLKGTSITGDYKYRIIAPIYLNNRLVSYQGRDITDRSLLKYKACKKENEVIHHKHTLYGIDKVLGDTVIVVEGITDVWRLGVGAVATFGIEYTTEQVVMLHSRFQKIFILYDAYPAKAVTQSEKLANELQNMGSDVEILELEKGDPGDMGTEEVRKLMNIINHTTPP